jgi:hypothetical protein
MERRQRLDRVDSGVVGILAHQADVYQAEAFRSFSCGLRRGKAY